MPKEQLESLWQVLHEQVAESRSVKGLRHKQATVLSIVFAYLLSGGQGGHRSIASFAQDLSRSQRVSVGCWFNRRTGSYNSQTENCSNQEQKGMTMKKFQESVWAWKKNHLGGRDGEVLVLDGKAL